MTITQNKESVMVCVHYGPHGQRLIQRGSQLSQLLGCPFRVLTVDSSKGNEYNRDKEQYLSVWERLTKEAGGEFLIRKSLGRRTEEVIIETARKHEVTQIIIGQSVQTLWQEITRGNFINELIERLGPIDLHIVAVQRYPDLLEETHEEGYAAYLVKQGDRYLLSDQPGESETLKGDFFQELHTDFNNGLFKTVWLGKRQYLKIVQGEWVVPRKSN
ncbi:MAG: universal stress protein [Bacillota bacterium]